MAQTEDGSGNVLDTSYYRYSVSGDSDGVVNGLEYVLNTASYARLAAAYSDPTAVSNSVLSGFADKIEEKITAGRMP